MPPCIGLRGKKMFEILTPSDWRKGNLIVEKRQMLIGIC